MFLKTLLIARNIRAVSLLSNQFKFSTESRIFKLEDSHISEAIKLQPDLSMYTPEVWQRAHQTFVNHGIDTIQFLRIATGHPEIIRRKPSKIIESLETWRLCQFQEHFMHLLLTKYPELLDIKDRNVFLKHITALKKYVDTNKNVWKVLMNSPDLMQQSEECFSEKFLYLRNEMRIDVPEIVKSEALSKDIFHIRCRHVFLDRLGMYTLPSLKANPNIPTKNPRLYQITDTSDKSYATKVCHVTHEEYETFKELFKRELQNKEADEMDDFSDDE